MAPLSASSTTRCKFPYRHHKQSSSQAHEERERRGGRQKFQVFWSHLCAFEYFGLVSHPHTHTHTHLHTHTHSFNLVRSSGRVQIAAQALITAKCPRILNYGSPYPPLPTSHLATFQFSSLNSVSALASGRGICLACHNICIVCIVWRECHWPKWNSKLCNETWHMWSKGRGRQSRRGQDSNWSSPGNAMEFRMFSVLNCVCLWFGNSSLFKSVAYFAAAIENILFSAIYNLSFKRMYI